MIALQSCCRIYLGFTQSFIISLLSIYERVTQKAKSWTVKITPFAARVKPSHQIRD